MISRRHFLATLAAGLTTGTFLGADRAKQEDNIRLGMMLQGASVGELQARAKLIAEVGFDAVQLTFFFHPSDEGLVALAATLKELGLKTVAFGTYFNLFRPEDTSFMRCSLATLKRLADHHERFGCRQFVTWSASYAAQFRGPDPRNHSAEAVVQLQRAIREVVLPVLEPVGGQVAFEPFYLHVLGTLELARKVLAPFPADRVGLVMDPPNFISPELYPQRDERMRRLFRELGERVHLVHFKDLKWNAKENRVDLPGPGDGEMNYPSFIAEVRRLNRPLCCIIEHVKPERAEILRAKHWVETQLRAR